MKKSVSFLIISIIFFMSCSENATDSALQPVNEPIHISGALNTNFESSQAILSQTVTENNKLYYFSIQGASDQDNFWQQASLKFIVKLEPAQDLRVGENFDISDQSASNKINYRSRWDESTYTDLVFEIDGGEIRVDSIDGQKIAGRFKIWAQQSTGRRMTHGQVEDLILSNQGDINVSGVFSVTYK